ncbi:MAG: GNAT family N-acetyltransferase [Verrucomicrobia bacterium]|nr:GNAT family N-acetyltransferase [Verrucomicrobiota bacterium]MBU1910598.1 GNAT family N-acetyltransferase [Verrucomicrobiota bacterium]
MKKTKIYHVREAGFVDAPAIFAIIKRHPDELVPRPLSDIIQNIDRFLVAEVNRTVVGCAAWGILPEIGQAKHPTIEIKSVAVDRTHRGTGLGCALVEAAIRRVKKLKPEMVIVLTFTPEFFRRFGFSEVPKESIMHKLYTGCLNCSKYDSPFTCPEVAMGLTWTDGRGPTRRR